MMGEKRWSVLVGLMMLVAGCGDGIESSATVPLDLSSEVVISNGSLDVAITDVEAIETARFTTTEISVSDEFIDVVSLYRVTVEFTNVGDGPVAPRHTTLDLTVADRVEDHPMYVTGFCEPAGSDPTGPADLCFKLSPPGGYGVVSVYQENPVQIAPGETSQLEYVLMVDNIYGELVFEFPEEPTEEEDPS